MAERTAVGNFYHYSEKASDIARNLAFVGFAVIWIFHVDVGTRKVLPRSLGFAAFLLIVGLAIDLVHYAGKAMYWAWHADGAKTDADEKRANRVGTITAVFLLAKIAAVLWAYGLMAWFLNSHVLAWRGEEPPPALVQNQLATSPSSQP